MKIYNYTVLISIFIFFVPTIQAKCDEATRQEIKNLITHVQGPYFFYARIDSAKVAAFATENLIKAGYNKDKINQWNDLMDCSFEYVLAQINEKNAPKKYAQYITTLKEINIFLKNTIKGINKLYSTDPRSLQANTEGLKVVKKYLKSDIKATNAIFSSSFKNIVDKVGVPEEWKRNIDKDLKSIFPNYETFFATYEKAKKLTENKELTPKELGYFLNIALKIPYKQGKPLAEEHAANNFVDLLEKFAYRVDQDLKASFFGSSKKEKILTESLEIIEGLKKLYPQMIPRTYFLRLPLTKDISSLIMLGFSGSLNSIASALKRNINTLLKKGEK
jgi:hypothetical protein